jgi:hypothetical protein
MRSWCSHVASGRRRRPFASMLAHWFVTIAHSPVDVLVCSPLAAQAADQSPDNRCAAWRNNQHRLSWPYRPQTKHPTTVAPHGATISIAPVRPSDQAPDNRCAAWRNNQHRLSWPYRPQTKHPTTVAPHGATISIASVGLSGQLRPGAVATIHASVLAGIGKQTLDHRTKQRRILNGRMCRPTMPAFGNGQGRP